MESDQDKKKGEGGGGRTLNEDSFDVFGPDFAGAILE